MFMKAKEIVPELRCGCNRCIAMYKRDSKNLLSRIHDADAFYRAYEAVTVDPKPIPIPVWARNDLVGTSTLERFCNAFPADWARFLSYMKGETE